MSKRHQTSRRRSVRPAPARAPRADRTASTSGGLDRELARLGMPSAPADPFAFLDPRSPHRAFGCDRRWPSTRAPAAGRSRLPRARRGSARGPDAPRRRRARPRRDPRRVAASRTASASILAGHRDGLPAAFLSLSQSVRVSATGYDIVRLVSEHDRLDANRPGPPLGSRPARRASPPSASRRSMPASASSARRSSSQPASERPHDAGSNRFGAPPARSSCSSSSSGALALVARLGVLAAGPARRAGRQRAVADLLPGRGAEPRGARSTTGAARSSWRRASPVTG